MLKTVTTQCEPGEHLINLYGNHEHYKPFPYIGDTIDDKGMLVAWRKQSVTKHHPDDDLHADNLSDRIIYTYPGAVVKNVVVGENYNYITFTLMPVSSED